MARRTKEEIRIDRETDAAFLLHGHRRQFNMLDLSKIRQAGIAAGRAGQDIGEAVRLACDQFAIKEFEPSAFTKAGPHSVAFKDEGAFIQVGQ